MEGRIFNPAWFEFGGPVPDIVDGLNEITYWILGWSGRAKVIRPDSLRLAILDHLNRATELNQRG